MGSISFWMCLVMTICTWNKTIGCTWMKTLPRSPSMFQVFSNNTITMLKKMVGYRVMFIHLFLVIELLSSFQHFMSCYVSFKRPDSFLYSNNDAIFCLYFWASQGHEVSRGPQITFPDKQYRQVNKFKADEQIAFISHTLNAIKKLYSSGKYESTAWDQKGVDKFMNDLYRQTSELDQCVKAMKTRLSKSVNRVNKKMSLHFKFLKHYLKREDYSASGWEDIRTVVLAHLQRLDTTLSSQ
ncbi:uncharacterized protein LOC127929989 isoform X1 [Oncorhynchus keta]|uniref:uncharacterized protein LOC127929989 isoform X1 n=1 Tax=Oncorhynchus keta TaxID=8018 RepID=UPI00227C575E|nr:uncharacterized protein LOC127929989 isoform X1 [Oncorhynchus keta]